MSLITAAFADELEKLGGILGRVLKKGLGTVAKHPMKALGVGMVVAPTIMAAKGGYESGMQDGEKPRYLSAGRGDDGKIHASEAAYTNYHQLFEHKPSASEVRALSKHYKPEMFQRRPAAETTAPPRLTAGQKFKVTAEDAIKGK